MSRVSVEHITKSYQKTVAVSDLSFTVEEGQIVTLLGPSGCGKTTTLRMIAGLIIPDQGAVYFGERRVDRLPPYVRNIGMVFQNYAIFPHMNVYENVAFGLRIKKVSEKVIKEKVMEALRLIKMEEYASRKPSQLSGGQQQRIALARALAVDPDVLLLDEPLSNLDAKLRESVRVELRYLIKETGKTTIFVTHDQIEALSMSDKIILMHQGKVEQEGTPEDLYCRPTTEFAADFIGTNNFLKGTLEEIQEGMITIRLREGKLLKLSVDRVINPGAIRKQANVTLCVRPEEIPITENTEPTNGIECMVLQKIFLGASNILVCQIGQSLLKVEVPSRSQFELKEGKRVYLSLNNCQVIVRTEA